MKSKFLHLLNDELVKMVNLVMQSLKATKRQSDTTIFAKSLKSLKSIFANRGVMDVRVSLGQYRTDYQRISNLYLTPNRFFTRFAAVFALVFVLGVGNVWGATHTWSYSFAQNDLSISSGNKTFTGKIDGSTNKNVTWACSAATYVGWDSSKGIQIGSGSKPQKNSAWTMSTAVSNLGSNIKITKVTAYLSVASSGGGKYIFSAGTASSGSSGTTFNNTSATNKEYSIPSGTTITAGDIVISLQSTASKAMYIKSITITYEDVTANPFTVNFDAGSGVCEISSREEESGGLGITLPSASPSAACIAEGWEFAGWKKTNAQTETTTVPTLYAAGTTYHPLANETLYAVYKFAEGGTNCSTGKITASEGLTIGDKVVLIYETGKMQFDGVSSNIGQKTGYSTTPSETHILEIRAGNNSGQFSFYDLTDENYLALNSDGNNLHTASIVNNNSSWTVTFSSGNATISNVAYSTRQIRYNTSSPRFACYTGSQQAVQLYKVCPSTITYNSNPSCCEPLAQINGSVSLSQKSATLSWDLEDAQNGGKDHITSWKVEYKKDGDADWTVAESTLAKATLTKTITGLTCNSNYSFRVSANVESGYCDIVKEWTAQKTTKFTITKEETHGGGITLDPAATSVCDGDVIDVIANTPDGSHEGNGTIKVIETGSNPENNVTSTVYNSGTGKLTMPAYDITISATYAEKTSPSVGVSVAALDFESPKKGEEVAAKTFSLTGSALTVGTLTLVAPSGYTVSPSSIEVASAGNLSAQTITVTPNTGTAGTFNGSISVSGAGVASTDIVSLAMTVLETYTVNWYVNGQLEHSQTDVANTDYDEVPSDFSAFKDCEDLTFVGWKEGAIDGGSTTSAPSLATIGTKITADKNYYAVFADGTPGDTNKLFEETFDSCDGTGGNDGSWSGQIAQGDIPKELNEWNFIASKAAKGCVKCGSSSLGKATTPKLALTGAATLTFKAAAWNGNSESTNLKISAEGATLKQNNETISSVTMTKAAWTSYTVDITNGNGEVTITFEGNAAGNARFFLDDVVVTQEVAPVWTKWYTTCPHYYTVSLTNDGIVDGKGSFVADKASALEGESVTLTATPTPNAGRFKTWSITGLDSYSTTTNPLTFDMPDNDITVSATFDALYAITKELVHGSFDIDKNYAIAGETVTISNVAADAQYENPQLEVYYIENEVKTTVSLTNNTFLMPAHAVKVKVSCSPAIQPLDAPVLGEATDATYQGVTLNWTGVAGNEGYVLTVQQGGVDVEGLVNVAIAQNATSYTIASGLAANTDYTYSIYTKGNGTTTMEVNTPANGNFSTVDYPNVTFYYSENGTLSAGESKKILTDFELADPVSDPCTKKFVGWSTETVAETDVEPAMMAPGATYQIPTNANCTIYAVYATEVPGAATQWTIEKADLEVLDSQQSSAYDKYKGDQSKSGITYNIADVMPGATQGHSGDLQIKKSSGKLYNKTAFNKDIISIVITGADISVFEGTSEISSTPASGAISATGSGPYTYTFSSGKRYFHIQNATNSAAYPSSITVNVAGSTTYAAYATTCAGKVATPSFSGVTDSETYEENKTVSLGCATGEATIRYTMSNDGTTPADPTGESTAATSISLNADGVYVIKAKAFKDGMDASDVATISVTINKPCTTIAEFIAATPKSAKKLVFTAESNAVVLGVNTNRIYIQDPTGGLLLYKTAHEKTWTKGKKVVGTVIGTYELTDNSPRMVVTDFGETVATIDGEIPSAVVIEGAINANFAANRNKLVTISDLHFQAQSVGGGNSINITRGDDTYQIYNAFNALNDHVLPLTETACSVTGILGYHSNKYQLMPIDANCITTGATAVLPEFVGETGGADAEHPTEVASGEVIKLTAAEGMTSNYTIGESAPVSITTNTEAVISGANNDLIAITISAEREYYTDNSVTYYYKINNALTKYIITSAVVENGTFKVKNSDASAEITSAVAGATVTLVAEPTHTETAQYSLDHWTVYETGNTSNTVSVENNQFMMPSFAVTVSATFAEDAYATVVFDGGDATGTAPASEKKYVGQEVTMPNKGALVKADHVLASWTYNETEYAVGDTYEIQAGDAAIGGNEITFTANWTPYPWANGGDWMLVTDAAEVTAGSYVIIAAAASNVAMSTTQNNNNRAQQSISKTDNTLTYDETAPAIFEVRAGNIENTLAFYDVVNEGYIYAAGSGKGNNHLKTETTLSNNSSWIIEDITSAGVAKVEAQGTNTNNKLQHNSSSSLFSCYNDYSQSSIALYKYYAPVPKVTYDKNTEDEVTNMPNPSVQRTENNKAVIAAGPSRTGYTFEGWKNGNTTYTVGEEYTFTEDITLYAQWAALPSFHVTYNTSGSQGTTPTDATNYYEGDEVILASASGLSNAGYFFDQWVATYVDGNSETQTLVIEDGKFTMPAFNVTVTATWARKSSDKWIKVTAISQLVADKEYIIVNTDATYAVGAQNTNNRAAAAIEENNGILTISDAVAKFTLGIPEADRYTFENGGKYLYASSSSKNYLHEQTENDANGVWTISIGEEGAATVTATGENSRNIMRYNPNNGSPVFSCYASNSSVQNPVVLYYKAPKIEINDSESVNVSVAAGSDIVIHEGGTLTVDASASIGDLTVEAGGQVVLDANKLTVVGTFTIETTMASGKSGQLNGATVSNFEAQEDAYIDITLGDNGNPEKWHAFTVPFPVDAINGIYDLDGKKLANEVNYAIMDYHGDIRATGKYGWKKFRGIMTPGTFYLMTVDGLRTTYRFKKTANGAIVAGNTKALYEYASSTGGNDNGWNGVGNPTLMYGTVDQNVQVLNPVSYTYEPYTAGNQNFVVGTPFFVQAASDGTMTMSAADGSKQYYAPARQSAKEIKDVKVTFGNEEYTDKLYISASEDALNEYETGKDLAKMTMTSTPKVAQIFGKAYNAKLCMVYAPMANDQAVYDLTLYAPKAGEYTIAAPAMENADLYLTYEGSIIWDLTMGAYTNNFAKGNNEGYGLLLQAKMPMTPTGVDEVQSDKVQCTKVVIDEHVYILRGGQMYDVTGKAVK